MSKHLVSGPVAKEIISEMISESGNPDNSGGISLFLGRVREDIILGKRVAAIEYSAYEPMVNQEAEKIRNEILSEYDDVHSVEIVHSTGVVKVGEISLFVRVNAGHRKQAMAACSEVVERLKKRVPVWKKELFGDDTHRWRENQ
jgi:molybdopterin synthase catalytic subunit